MLQIMNAALVSQGLDAAVSETDSNPEFTLLVRNWPIIVEAELQDGLYSFTKQEANLQTRTDGLFGFPDAYALPADCLHVRHVWSEDADGIRDLDMHWVEDGSRVHVDKADGVMIEYLNSAATTDWLPRFVKGIQLRLESVIRRSVWEEASEARMLDQMADAEFDRARVISSKSRSAREPFRDSRFSKARFLRG
jgi:hypothetical protein